MKPKTVSLLSALLKEHSKPSLIRLWADISSLSQEEFTARLDEIGGIKPRAVKKPVRKKPKGPADDKPVTRIAHHLRSKLGLSDERACWLLQDALMRSGVNSARFPPNAGADLESWLYELLGQVPDSNVMAIAKKLKV